MESINLKQPKKTETSAVLRCSKCGKDLYTETIVESFGKPVERVVIGQFRQTLNSDGEPCGPVIPFCNCGD